MQVKAFALEQDERKKRIAKLLASPRNLLITLMVLNVCMNILIQNVAASIFGDFSAWILNVGVPLSLTLIFGEVIPKTFGLINNTRISTIAATPLTLVSKILLPLRKFLLLVTALFSRIFFFFLQKEKEISKEELKHALKMSFKYGVLGEDEAELMRGYLNLQSTSVKEWMRPRSEVLFYDLSEPLDRLIYLFVDEQCTRIPVCDGDLDKVIGVMAAGIFFLYKEQFTSSQDLLPFLKKPFFVPEATSAEILLDQMYEKRESLAIIIDEYGSFSGLITLEDLIEVVIGQIEDKRDEKNLYTRSSEDVVIASGKLELSELANIFDVSLKSKSHMVTVGGWLTEQLGDIPKSGTKYIWNNLLFHVLASDRKRVQRVYIRKLKQHEVM